MTTHIQQPDVLFKFLRIESENGVQIITRSRYYTVSGPVFNVNDLRKEINEIFGYGSQLRYDRATEEPAKAVTSGSLYERGQLSPFVAGLKTDAIEQARYVAQEAWGRLPELECPAWERSFRDYTDQL